MLIRARGLADLVAATRDIAPPDHPAPRAHAAATAEQRALFERYVTELRAAKEAADAWWDGLVGHHKSAKARAKAEAELRDEVPVGPAAHVRAIGVVRRFWLEVAARNRTAAADERVPPECLVLAWLSETGHDELSAFVASYRYWPVGLDVSGRWV